ncbi:MAG: hypothetical protein JWM95_1863 [Gemmatimonadetes bacterium]|nr:hypothetical protein [Gemmatimonadota bacterium]
MTDSMMETPVNSVPWRAATSSIALLALILLAGVVLPMELYAQRPASGSSADSARAAADSLAARLRRAEEAIALLHQQLGEQASTAVTTRSRMQLELTGRIAVHSFYNDGRVNNVDDPQIARPDSASSIPSSAFGMAIRQTTLGAVITARDVLGGRFVGDIDVDFFGGQQPSSGGRNFPLMRVRTARGTVKWPNGEIMVGQESPLIVGVNPITPAAIGTPDFATAGNLWLWLPQARGTIETSGRVRFALQGAVIGNITGDGVGTFDTDADAAEKTGRPAGEGRLRVRWGEDERAGEVGCGGHVGWVAVPAATRQTNAVACDAHISLMSGVEIRGEAYSGRGLRGLGGGGISQNIGRSAAPLSDKGGWGQLNVDVHPVVRVGAGFGEDQPDEPDVPAGGRLNNQALAAYTIIKPGGPVFLGVELRRLTTRYATGSVRNNHISISTGFEF